MEKKDLEERLNSFGPKERRAALKELARAKVKRAPESGNVNMHFHSFFSFNAGGWSPNRIAWEARKLGLYAAGLCDFDVLDGREEFLAAGELLGLRAAVSLETRVFLREYADKEITSPGEPGVTYIMGAGFAREIAAGTEQAGGLAFYRKRAKERNLALIERINPRIAKIAIDYENDVLKLTPTGSATERHIVRAYLNKSEEIFADETEQVRFWAGVLGRDEQDINRLMKDRAALEGAVRIRLVKRGGLGYRQPDCDTFPGADDFIRWALSCEAVPMITWLDGTSPGEEDGRVMLECLRAKGCAALNIIPDRNWNVSDPEEARAKQKNLREIVRLADAMDLPINIGTEMNKEGQPLFDNLDGEALRPYRETFLRGARVLVGHSILSKFADFSYPGAKAGDEFGDDLKAKNEFFASVGALEPLTEAVAGELRNIGEEKALAGIRDSVKRGRWVVG